MAEYWTLLLLGHEGQHRFHERRLLPAAETDCMMTASGASELAAICRQVADQLVGFFAHHAAPLEVCKDAVEHVRIV